MSVCKQFQTIISLKPVDRLQPGGVGMEAALGFGPDRIRTLVSMATDSSGKTVLPPFLGYFSSDLFILAGTL